MEDLAIKLTIDGTEEKERMDDDKPGDIPQKFDKVLMGEKASNQTSELLCPLLPPCEIIDLDRRLDHGGISEGEGKFSEKFNNF